MSWFDDNNPERPQQAPTTIPLNIQPGAPSVRQGQDVAGSGLPTGSLFSKTSTSADLLAALNKAGAAPGSAQATALTKQYTDALGISGNALQAGFSVGQYDPERSKIYLPGTDLKYDNGQWGDHPYSPADQQQGMQGDLLQPFTEQLQLDPFTAPTGVDETNDPGYKARLAILQDARQRQAAAQGNLLSGSTSTALDKEASDYASNEYNNVYGRAYQTWAGNQQQKLTGYQARENTFYANQNNPFAKLYAMSSLDSSNQNALNQLNLGYANLGANTITNGGNQYANYLTQGANAGAAGQVAAGNAYAGAFGTVSQLPFQYAAYNSLFNKPPVAH